LFDESIGSVDVARMSTRTENDFLESMLAWERAPMVPVAEWFDPPLALPEPDTLDAEGLRRLLLSTVDKLYAKKIVLEFTDHLSDRELYTLISRDILAAYEKKLDHRASYLHWDCADTSGEPEKWLRYYATIEERDVWQDETGGDLPPMCDPPFPRELPREPM
jgi:hypothetical protein